MPQQKWKPKRKRPWWVGPDRVPRWYEALIVLAIFGSVAAIGVYQLIAAVKQGVASGTTEGTVVAFEINAERRDRSATYAPVVEYQVGEKKYRCRGIFASPSLHYIGQKVPVLYKLETPADGHVDSFVDRWLGGLCFSAIGLPLLLWAIFSLFFSRMFYEWRQKQISGPKTAS